MNFHPLHFVISEELPELVPFQEKLSLWLTRDLLRQETGRISRDLQKPETGMFVT